MPSQRLRSISGMNWPGACRQGVRVRVSVGMSRRMRSIARFAYSLFVSPMPRLQLKARKQPSQARSQATVETILEAAARVFAKQSLAGFNTNRVADVAGVNVGSLYQYFPNKKALVVALLRPSRRSLALAVEATVLVCAGQCLRDGLLERARLAIALPSSTAARPSPLRWTTRSAACPLARVYAVTTSAWWPP